MQYVISGMVIKGKGYGKKLGYPTVNLDVKEKELPEMGVYAGSGILDGKTYRAGIVIDSEGNVEAHLIGYDGDAYGKKVTLEIEKFLREFKNFDNKVELIEQIRKDVEICSQE